MHANHCHAWIHALTLDNRSTPDSRCVAALSKHLALPCAKAFRFRDVFFAPTALRLENATLA